MDKNPTEEILKYWEDAIEAAGARFPGQPLNVTLMGIQAIAVGAALIDYRHTTNVGRKKFNESYVKTITAIQETKID